MSFDSQDSHGSTHPTIGVNAAPAYRASSGRCQWSAGLVAALLRAALGGLVGALLPAALAGLVLFACVRPAEAAGFWGYDKGTSLFGRAGANVAAPADPAAAMLTNPAALAGLPGLQLMVDGDLFYDFRSFARAPTAFDLNGDGDPDEQNYDKVTNGFRPVYPSPGLFLSYNFAKLGLPGLTAGAAVHGPPLVHTEFPADGPQRYSQIANAPLQIHYVLGAGYELPWLGLRLGASATLLSQIFDSTLALNTFVSFPEASGYDATVHVKTAQHLIPVGQFAASIRPLPPLTLAASFRTPWDVDAAGEAEITLGEQLGRVALVEGNRLRGLLKMPPVLRAAAQYRDPEQRFEVEAGMVWEWWSRSREVTFSPKGISVGPRPGNEFLFPDGAIELDDIVIESRYRNTYSACLGGQVRIVPELLLARAGVFYSRAAVGKGRLNLGTLDLDKAGVTLGSRVELPWQLWLDVAFGYVQMFEKEVEEGKTRIKNPLTVPPTDMWPVADGAYSGYQLDFQIALGIAFDV